MKKKRNIVRLHFVMYDGHKWTDEYYVHNTIRGHTLRSLEADQYIMCRVCNNLGFIKNARTEVLTK